MKTTSAVATTVSTYKSKRICIKTERTEKTSGGTEGSKEKIEISIDRIKRHGSVRLNLSEAEEMLQMLSKIIEDLREGENK